MNGLILFSYGTIHSLDDVEPFYNHIFNRRLPNKQIIEKGIQKYAAIGTCDPLGSYSIRIAKALEKRLSSATSQKWKVYIGNKHTSPFIGDVVKQCIEDGVTKIFTLPLSPLYSHSGTKKYERTVKKQLAQMEAAIPVLHIHDYFDNKAFIMLISERLQDAINWLPNSVRAQTKVIFTAHSQPGLPSGHKKFIRQYQHLAEQTVASISWRNYEMAYRSGNPKPQVWLEPDVLEVIHCAANNGFKAVVVCELLSMIENVEAIYEAGVDCQQLAQELHLDFVRTQYLNDSHDFIEVLMNLVLEKWENDCSKELF